MIITNKYSHTAYDRLLDFDYSKKHISAISHHIMELGKLICKHGFSDIAGINLLHKHFDISKEHFLVKRLDKNTNTATIEPKEHSSHDKVVPYLWSVTNNTDQSHRFEPLEFIETDDVSIIEAMKKVTAADEFLKDLADYLQDHDLMEILGLCLIHQSVELSSSQIMGEETDFESKKLVLSAMRDEITDDESVTETTWAFNFLSVDGVLKVESTEDESEEEITIEKNGEVTKIRFPKGKLSKILDDEATIAGLCVGCCKAHCIRCQEK